MIKVNYLVCYSSNQSSTTGFGLYSLLKCWVDFEKVTSFAGQLCCLQRFFQGKCELPSLSI